MDNGLFTVQLFLGTMYGGHGHQCRLNVRAGADQLALHAWNIATRKCFSLRINTPRLAEEALRRVSRRCE